MKTKQFFLKNGRVMSSRNEAGSITVVFIALLAIMMILVVSESRALIHLRLEEKLLEKRQVERFNSLHTNMVVAVPAEAR